MKYYVRQRLNRRLCQILKFINVDSSPYMTVAQPQFIEHKRNRKPFFDICIVLVLNQQLFTIKKMKNPRRKCFECF